jgi:heat shock protein 4
MYFGKLRDIAANELKVGVSDVVIAVPGWYTDIQRRAVLDAAAIANLNVLRLINDTTATALGYGITKTDLPEPEAPRNVAFVDVGHATLSVSIVAFAKGQLNVLSTAYEQNLGGRDIDYALVQHFAKEFTTKYKIDVLSNPKAIFRLTAGCEKLKKVLSANAEAVLNVESIMNDIDANSKLNREELEALIAPLLETIDAPIKAALAEAKLDLDQIHSIELVGGSTRVPAVKQKIQDAFGGRPLSFTLNQDEAIARGATFACAMLSPVFRVREFHMHDINHYPIRVSWDPIPTDPDDDTELLVFPQGNTLPSTKVLSFYRKESFQIQASYAEPEKLPGSINPWIANLTAKEVPVPASGDNACVKVRTRLNIHGIMSFESAYVEEVEEKEEPAPMDVDPAAAAPDAPDAADAAPVEAPPAPKKKRVVKKKDIPFVATNSSLSTELVEKYKESEAQMHSSDKLVFETEVRFSSTFLHHR